MRAARLINWTLPLVTAAVYAWLALYLGGQLRAQAGGAPPFDLRVFGYSFNEARAYLQALSPAGYALYQGPSAWADTVFPPLLGLTLAWWMRPYAGAFGMVCVMAAMSYVALDWGENHFVQRMLTAGPDLLAYADVQRASVMTKGKFAALTLTLVLAARQSWIRWRSRPSSAH